MRSRICAGVTFASARPSSGWTVSVSSSQNLAGSISHSWTFDPPDVASVDSKNDGVSTFVGEKVGKTTATVTGAGVTATISIEVK